MKSNATIVRVRGTGKDKYGDPIAGTPDRLTLDPAAVYPRQSTPVDDRARDGVVIGLTLIVPDVDADIVDGDQVEVNGDLYDLDGTTGQWRSPLTGWEPGLTVALKRAVG